MIFLGKVESQDSFLCFDGENIILTKSVRRVSTSWKSHLSFYASFKISKVLLGNSKLDLEAESCPPR